MSSSPWSVVARFITIGEAEAAVSALDAAGIECQLADENIVGVDWGMAQAVGGVKILVRQEDLERASEVMSLAAADQIIEPIPELVQPDVAVVCPECGAADFVMVPRFRIFLLISAIFLGIGVVVNQELLAATALIAVAAGVLMMPAAHCRRCLHRWTPEESQERIEAPLPQPSDTIEEPCPRCGSYDVYQINDRRLKAWPLLFSPSIFAIIPLWLLSPKRQCEKCGLKLP
ncbi:MAG TPA: DUF2007 domain-containing protein [Thermoanaerobaculia bacterium]|nr:DUF2007 domain-containing protein [Thermoanaerobaculia bacterium]